MNQLPNHAFVQGLALDEHRREARKDAELGKLFELLDLLGGSTATTGGVKAMEAFLSKNGPLLEKDLGGVKKEDLIKKAQLLALCAACEGKKEVDLKGTTIHRTTI